MILLFVLNAHIQCEPPGTWNLQKLQLELKYFGKNVADARLDWRFNFWSSTANTCTVPWSLDTQSHVESWLKFILLKQKTIGLLFIINNKLFVINSNSSI